MKKDSYYGFGYKRFGPFLYGFTRWLNGELERCGCKRIIFFSRDGYMMQKAFDIVSGGRIASEYAYFSRKSLSLALLCGCGSFEETLEYLPKERFISAGKLLEFYGFGEAERQRLAAEGSFCLDAMMGYDGLKKDPLARRLFEENRAAIISAAERQDRLLLEYTAQLGMRGRFAIADIGWHGNMQYYLETFFKRHGLEADFEGYYIGILPDRQLSTKVHGYYYSPSAPEGKKRLLCFFGVLEKLLQSDEGSAAGYKEEGGRVVPSLMPYEYEGDRRIVSIIHSWQRGALDFVRKAHRADLNAPDERLTEPLIRFGAFPTLEETRLFSFFYNVEGTRIYYTPQKPLYRFKPKEFIYALSESPWKTGFMRSAFKLPLPYYRIYSILKKDQESRAESKKKTVMSVMRGIKKAVKAFLDEKTGLDTPKYKKISPRAEVISFDIFDTLVLRDLNKPSDLFVMLERELNIPDFARKRTEAERAARAKKAGGEVTIDEIYRCFEGISPEEAEKYRTAEIKAELRVCRANPRMMSFYGKCAENRRVILVSDMYLTSDIIKSILDKCGITGYERLYVSCGAGVSKRSGELYGYVLSDLGIKADKMMHIGNDIITDVLRARQRGIKCVKLRTIPGRSEKT